MTALIILLIVFSQISAFIPELLLIKLDVDYFMNNYSPNDYFIYITMVILINIITIFAVIMLIMKNKSKRLLISFAFICLFASFVLVMASLYKGITLQILLKEASNEPGYINEGAGLTGLLFYYSISVTELMVFILSIIVIIKAKRDKMVVIN